MGPSPRTFSNRPSALARPDIDRGFWMLDHGRSGHAEAGRHVRPLEDRGLGPGQRCRLEDPPPLRFGRAGGARFAGGRLARAAHGNDPEGREFDAGKAEAGTLAVNRFIGFLEQLDQFARYGRGHRAVGHRHHQVMCLPPVAHVDRARELRLLARESRLLHGGDAALLQFGKHGVDALVVESFPGIARAAAGAQHQRALSRLLNVGGERPVG